MGLVNSKYGFDVLNGNVFIGSTAAAGVTVPIFSNTTQQFGLWNPAGSGKNVVLIRCDVGYVGTPGTAGNLVYGFLTGVGSALATAAPLSAFTSTTPKNALMGGGATSVCLFAQGATITLTTAATVYKYMGVSQLAPTAAATTTPMWTATDVIDGAIVLPPSTAIFVAANVAAFDVADISLTWEEV